MSQQVKADRTILAGTSSNPLKKTYNDEKALQVYTTCASTNASTSYEPVKFSTTMTGAGQVGGRVLSYTTANVALGGWCNALKSYFEFGSAGKTTGLASSMCVEMKMANADLGSGGAYYPLEIEYVAGGTATASKGSTTGNQVGFIYMNNSGDADGDFDDNGFVMRIAGLTAGSGHVFATGANTGTIAGSLRCIIGSTAYYIPLWSSAVVT